MKAAAMKQKYQRIWNSDSFDPYKDQVIVKTAAGGTIAIEFVKEEKKWHGFYTKGAKFGAFEDIKGLDAIHAKVNEFITCGFATDIFIDAL